MRAIFLALLAITCVPSLTMAAERVVTMAPDNPMAGTVRLGAATGGPSLHDLVPADVAEKVFTSNPTQSPPTRGSTAPTAPRCARTDSWRRSRNSRAMS